MPTSGFTTGQGSDSRSKLSSWYRPSGTPILSFLLLLLAFRLWFQIAVVHVLLLFTFPLEYVLVFFFWGGLVLCVRVVWWWHHLRVFYLLWGLENILSLFALGEHPEHPVTKMLVTAVLTISYQSWITSVAFVLMKKTVSLKQSRVEWFNFIEAGIFHSPYRMFKTTP